MVGYTEAQEYFIRIRARNSNGKGDWGYISVRPLNTPASPASASVRLPQINDLPAASAGKLKLWQATSVVVEWSAAARADRYYIHVSENATEFRLHNLVVPACNGDWPWFLFVHPYPRPLPLSVSACLCVCLFFLCLSLSPCLKQIWPRTGTGGLLAPRRRLMRLTAWSIRTLPAAISHLWFVRHGSRPVWRQWETKPTGQSSTGCGPDTLTLSECTAAIFTSRKVRGHLRRQSSYRRSSLPAAGRCKAYKSPT